MKYVALLLTVLVCTTTFFGCKKDSKKEDNYQCATCNRQPTALAANDASSKGIYKGTVVGSSGTIMFDVANNGSTINAVMVIDGTTVNLTSSISWQSGQPYVAPFTGTLNGQAVSITFSVAANGGSPIVTSSSIPGHPNASFTLIKETSSSLIETFEGTYTSSVETGTFNIVLSRALGLWGGIARKTGTTSSSSVNGTITNNQLFDPSNNNRMVGTLNGDVLTGNFVDRNNTTITINGHRTL